MSWRWARLESVLRSGGFLDKVRGLLPESLRSLGEDLCAMRLGEEGLELIVVLSPHSRLRAEDFEGQRFGCGDDEVLFCPFSVRNAATLRALFPWCGPSLLGRNSAFGMGYRSPWVLGNLFQARSAARHEVTTVLAQQSARELERTGRTFQAVADSAAWAAFAAGLTLAWGADADHLKTGNQAREAARAGFTLFTYDVADEIRGEPRATPAPSEIDTRPRAENLIGQRFEIVAIEGEPLTYQFTREDLARLEMQYRAALAKLKGLYEATARELGNRPFDVEISLDETEAETEPIALLFLTLELTRMGVRFRCIAPRFPGNFEKAVDFFDGWTEAGVKNAEVRRFRERLLELAAISRHFGFKLGIHTASDKFRIYPLLARTCRDAVHVKTAGTTYLEELRVVAARAPGLFREIAQTSLALFEKERRSYALSTHPERIPALGALTAEELVNLLRSEPANDDLRQVLHVSYGPVIRQYGEAIYAVLARNPEDLEAFLGEHLARHVYLCGQDGSAVRFRAIESDPLEGDAVAIRARLDTEDYLGRLSRAEARAREEGIEALDPTYPIVQVGMVVEDGRVARQRLGVFGMARSLAEDPEPLDQVRREVAEIRERVRSAHGAEVRNVIWAGPSGSAEDKLFLDSLGMFGRTRIFVLDSTDPACLDEILDRIKHEAGGDLARSLKGTLAVVVAARGAGGGGAEESAIHVKVIDELYRNLGIESESNFLYLAPPDSPLDGLAASKGWKRVDLQLDAADTTAERHAAPLTRACLYPLALNDHDLRLWAKQTVFSPGELSAALDLASFIEAQAAAGRTKMVVGLPAGFEGAGPWMKQGFEQGLGANGKKGLKIVVGESIRLEDCFPAGDPRNDRFFIEIEVEGFASNAIGPDSLSRAGYSVFQVRLLKGTDVARFMQFLHHVVFALGYVRETNVVTQPSMEEYERWMNRIWEAEAARVNGTASTPIWQALERTPHCLTAGELALYLDSLVHEGLLGSDEIAGKDAPAVLAHILESARAQGIEYAELLYFGDMRFSTLGRNLRVILEEVGSACFRSPLRMPVDIGEGPAMSRISLEMTRGWGHGLTILIVAAEHTIGYGVTVGSLGGEYLKAQWLAAKAVLEERSRWVIGIRIPRLSPASIKAIGDLFGAAAKQLSF